MKRRSLAIFALLLLISFTFFLPHSAFSLYSGKPQSEELLPEYAPGKLIVKYKPEAHNRMVMGKVTTGIARIDSLNTKYKVKRQERLFKEFEKTALKLDKFSSVYLLEVPLDSDLAKMKAEYENLPEVEYVELDYMMELFEVPDDPLFGDQWYLNNTGQGYLGINRIPGDYNDSLVVKYGTAGADIDALEAFGKSIELTQPLVGIIDTGVDREHEDLADNIWTNPGEIPDNGMDDDHNGFIDDFYGWDFSGDEESPVPLDALEDNDPSDSIGHGTHCAGIAAAVRDNGKGVSGITSPCRIMAIKTFPFAYYSVCAKGIIYAVDMGCDVINMSWGGPYFSGLIRDAIAYADGKGVLAVAAAGNSGGEDHFYPASYTQAFTVGASNSRDEVTYFSTYGEYLNVIAPGEDILSLRAVNTDMYETGGASGIEPNVHIVDYKYYLADGTSMAAPCAAGVAAFVLAASPGISLSRLKEIIQESADDIIYPYGGDSLYSPGKDIYSGYGRVNLNSALQLLSGRLAKIDYPFENMLISGYVPIIGTASGDSFQNYVLEYGEGYSPAHWTEIVNSTSPVSKETLGMWNSTGLSGVYTLRLSVGDQNRAVVHVIAGNSPYVKINSPNDGDTVKGYIQVFGYTIVPDFSSYTLDYGYGEFPTSWDTIITSTKIIANGVLGSWVVNYLDNADYTLRLTVQTSTGETHSDSVLVVIGSLITDRWFVQLSSNSTFSSAVGDVDGDGLDEIVIGLGQFEQPGGIDVFSHTGKREPGWPKDTNKHMMSLSPALGDLDGDGINDIVICFDSSYYESGINTYTSDSLYWYRYVNVLGDRYGRTSPRIADLDKDGSVEVLMMNNSGEIHVWRKNGESFIEGNDGFFARSSSLGSSNFICLTVADLDNDGTNEVISNGGNGIYIWDLQGNSLLKPGDYPAENYYKSFGIAIANIDNEDDLEIVLFGANQDEYFTLFAYKKDGSQVTGYPIVLEDLNINQWKGNQPAVGDLEGDGILEIVTSMFTINEARIYAWHQDGTPLGTAGSDGLLVSMKSPDTGIKRKVLSQLGNNIGEISARIREMSKEELNSLFSGYENDPIFASEDAAFGSPVLADVNGDLNVDIIVSAGAYFSTQYVRIFAWDYEGKAIPGWPLYISENAFAFNYYPYTPVICDVDRDNKLNIVLASDWPDFKLYCLELNTFYNPETSHWPKLMHDKGNSCIFEDYTGYSITDVIIIINYLFKGGPPLPMQFADTNCDGKITVSDVVYLINYLFKGGPPPGC